MTVIYQNSIEKHNLLKQNRLGVFTSKSLQNSYFIEIPYFSDCIKSCPLPSCDQKPITVKSVCSKPLYIRDKML